MVTPSALRLLFHPSWKEGPGWKEVTMASACQGLKLCSSFMQEDFATRGSVLPSSLCLPCSASLCTVLLWSPAR